MLTFRQALVKKRRSKGRIIKVPALLGCPQKRGFVSKVTIMKPKKPNSATRKIVKVRLTTRRIITAYICGCGHNIQEHSIVLVRGGRVRDLPGMHYKLIRGKFDFSWKENIIRNQSRSLFGISNTFKEKRFWKKKTKGRKKLRNKKKSK